jgi:hypothetical protein
MRAESTPFPDPRQRRYTIGIFFTKTTVQRKRHSSVWGARLSASGTASPEPEGAIPKDTAIILLESTS